MHSEEALEGRARWVRQQVLEMITGAGHGHIGGSYSSVEILLTLYRGGVLNVDPGDINNATRDIFILSKGHASEALYAVLADSGFIATEELKRYGENGHMLGGHADNRVAGIELSTGSLGHGLGVGAGLALSAKLRQEPQKTYVLMGDGETYEGSVWESAMFAAQQNLGNLVAIVDRNGQITLDFTENINQLEPYAAKWQAFGWDTVEVDGHSFDDLYSVFAQPRTSQKPLVVIANTVKGKGVSYMEGDLHWHHNVPKGEQVELARQELSNGK